MSTLQNFRLPRSRKFWVITLVGIVLLSSLIGAGCYLTNAYEGEWNYWKRLPGDTKWLVFELESERFWHRLFRPPLKLERYAHVTADRLEKAVRLGADWILGMQEPSGRFQYWYNPEMDEASPASDDNFLRQAGTGFSLALVYEMTGDMRYLNSALHNLQYLMGFKQELEGDKAYFLFKQKAKLGGVALPMLTMLKIRQLTGSTEYDETLQKLANMILYLQDAYGTGQFKSTYVYRGDYEHEKNSGWESRIYPGEALFALAEMYRAFGDARYRRSMDWAMDFYRRKKWKSHAFLPWTISAFVSLYEQTGDAKYADYVFFLSDHLLTQQNLDGDDAVYGSFHSWPSANTGSYMEGLGDAIALAQWVGDSKRLNLYRERAKMGYGWLLTLQYTPLDAATLRRPEMAIGGFRTDLVNVELRIDNTQHAIGGFTKGLRFVFEQTPRLETTPLMLRYPE